MPPRPRRCGDSGHAGWHAEVDEFGDHEAACNRTGLLARRAKPVGQVWVRVAREATGAEGQVVPQQWVSNLAGLRVSHNDRWRLDMVVYGTSPLGEVLCCDAAVVSPLTRTGQPHPGAATVDGKQLSVARRRKDRIYPELKRSGPCRLVVLACETGGRWSAECTEFVKRLVAMRAKRAPLRLRRYAALAWKRGLWSKVASSDDR